MHDDRLSRMLRVLRGYLRSPLLRQTDVVEQETAAADLDLAVTQIVKSLLHEPSATRVERAAVTQRIDAALGAAAAAVRLGFV